jgi:hypothetical protein
MPDRAHKETLQELKEMIQKKKPEEPVEKVLVDFCARHAIPLAACNDYYNQLIKEGRIKENR